MKREFRGGKIAAFSKELNMLQSLLIIGFTVGLYNLVSLHIALSILLAVILAVLLMNLFFNQRLKVYVIDDNKVYVRFAGILKIKMFNLQDLKNVGLRKFADGTEMVLIDTEKNGRVKGYVFHCEDNLGMLNVLNNLKETTVN